MAGLATVYLGGTWRTPAGSWCTPGALEAAAELFAPDAAPFAGAWF